MDADGDFVISWSSGDNQDGDSWGIYAQRFNAAGVAQGVEILVNTTTTDEQHYSSVGMDAAGNFVVTWSSKNQDGDGWGVYAQRFDASGSALGGEFRVANTTAEDQLYSNVSVNSAGDFVITWSSKNQDGDGWGVFAREYDAIGSAQGGEFQVNDSSGGDQQFSSVTMDASGNYVIVWSGEGLGDTKGVYGQRYLNASGLTFSAGDGTDDAVVTFRVIWRRSTARWTGWSLRRGQVLLVRRHCRWMSMTWETPAVAVHSMTVRRSISMSSAGLANMAPTVNVPGTQGTGEDTPLVLWGAGGMGYRSRMLMRVSMTWRSR